MFSVLLTQDDLWHAIESNDTEDGEADKIAPPVMAIDWKFGLPQLTIKVELQKIRNSDRLSAALADAVYKAGRKFRRFDSSP